MKLDSAALKAWFREFKKLQSLRLSTQLMSDRELTQKQLTDVLLEVGRSASKIAWSRYHDREYHFIEEGIELMERSWALAREDHVASRLGFMYQRAHRNEDAMALYRDALRLYPGSAQLRYQAAIHALRFCEYEDMRAYFEAALRFDANEQFSRFVLEILDSYDGFVEQVERSIVESQDQLPPYLLAFAVWGQPFVGDFMQQAGAALLSEGNIPALADQYRVHMVIFTTAASEHEIRSHPMFDRMAKVAKPHFVHYKAHWMNYARVMKSRYSEVMADDYILNCKFVLFSCAHRATLEIGRRVGGLVTPMGTDNIFNDGAFRQIGEIMKGPYDAVVVTGFRMLDSTIRPIAEARFRRPDGVLQIPEAEYSELLARHIPENCFAHSKHYTHFPLLACWRISDNEVLVHSNHYHPVCIRPAAIKRPIRLTIDPVDGQFMHRCLPDVNRAYLVQDTRVTLSDWGDNPLIVAPSDRGPDLNEMSLWLWMYWDSLRAPYFRTPIRIGQRAQSTVWTRAEAEAMEFVDRILAESARREAVNERRYSWRPENVPAEPGREAGLSSSPSSRV